MKQPSLDLLLKRVDSKYTLVVAAAKRAREITEAGTKAAEGDSNKPVTIALEEIAGDRVTFERTKSGIK